MSDAYDDDDLPPLVRWSFLEARVNGRLLVGMPGVRDPDAYCALFVPGEPAGRHCQTDGHYLCRECKLAVPFCAGCGHQPHDCECLHSQESPR